MKKLIFLGLVTTFALVANYSAHAAGAIGTSVTGSLLFAGNPNNYFDPSNGFVPSGYLNTSGTVVTVASPAVEFGFSDSTNTDLANFSAFQFTIEDVVGQNVGVSATNSPFTMTFTDTAFSGLTLTKATDFFPNGGLSYSLVGDTITINWAGGPVKANDDYTSTFALSNVPEPSSWGMLGLGVAGAGVMALRRRRAV